MSAGFHRAEPNPGRDCALEVAVAFSIDTVGQVRDRTGVDIPVPKSTMLDDRREAPLPLLEDRRTGQGNGLVDLRCVTADADRADNLAVEPYRDTALQRRAIGQG